MGNLIGLLNVIAIAATLASVIFLKIGWRRVLRRDINFMLLCFLALTAAYHVHLASEWFGFTSELQSIEDIIGALVAMGWVVVFYGFFNEVVDGQRRQTQEALIRGEKFLSTIIENIPDMIFVKDAKELRFVRFNKAGEELLGYSRQEMLGKNDHDLFPAEQADFFVDKDLEVLRLGVAQNIPAETIMTRHHGDRILNTKKIVLPDEKGNPEYLLGISADITERTLSAKALERWGRIFENAGWGVAVVGAVDWRLEILNPAFASLHDRSAEELLGRDIMELVAKDRRDQFRREIEASKKIQGHSFETAHLKKRDALFPVKIDVTYVGDDLEAPGYYVLNVQDISGAKAAEKNRKQLERRLRQAQKMESIGTLAGGIAHDFNNILGAIFGFSEVAMLDMDQNDKNYGRLESILAAAERAKELVRQILTFSRQTEINISPIMLGPIVKEAIKFLRSSIPADIEIRQNIVSEETMTLGDPTQLSQVVINLCTNAAHAMRETGGIIDITLAEFEMQFQAVGLDLPNGSYLRLTVSDTGHGIEKPIMEKIFEPYFTTKSKDGGTGLGLAMVHGIVKSHGGEIKVYSELGKGTVFQVYMPIVQQSTVGQYTENQSPPQGTENLMMVDDEKELTDAGRYLLEKLGYTVHAFNDSREALMAFQADPVEYDLIITDLTMPELNGIELAQKIKSQRADLPILLCTGFSQPAIEFQAKKIGIAKLMIKPITMHELAISVRQALDQER